MAYRTITNRRVIDVIVRKDGALLDYVCARRNGVLNPIMLSATWSSSLAAYLSLAIAGALIGGESGRVLLSMATAAGLTAAIAYVPKRIIARPRPTHASPLRHALLKHPDSWSFPSSHTATAFAAAVALGAALGPAALVCALGWAAIVGISRIYVGAHYPLDVLMGAAIGTLASVWLDGPRDEVAQTLAAILPF